MAWFDLYRGKSFDKVSPRIVAEMIADKEASEQVLAPMVLRYLEEQRKKDFRNEQGPSIQPST